MSSKLPRRVKTADVLKTSFCAGSLPLPCKEGEYLLRGVMEALNMVLDHDSKWIAGSYGTSAYPFGVLCRSQLLAWLKNGV